MRAQRNPSPVSDSVSEMTRQLLRRNSLFEKNCLRERSDKRLSFCGCSSSSISSHLDTSFAIFDADMASKEPLCYSE